MSIHPSAVASLLALQCACHSPPPEPVPVAGSAAALARLAGDWSGSYESPQTGRSGSIVFTLVAGEDHAHGDVVMIPSGSTQPFRPSRIGPDGVTRGTTAAPQVLRIVFVRASGDSVTGTLDSYFDPQCSCTAVSSFAGRLEGNTIWGTFTTRRAQGAGVVSGTWSVRRRG